MSEDEPPSEFTIEEPDTPRALAVLGRFGMYLALLGLGLTAVGLGAALVPIQPLTNISLFFALLSVTIAMVIGAAYQAYVSDLLA